MPFDDQIRAALDNAGATLGRHLDADLRAIAEQVIRVVADERQAAVAAASEQAASQARAKAEAQLAQLRALAQKHAEDLRRAAEGQIRDLRKAMADVHAHATQQIETARRQARDERERSRVGVEQARLMSNAEVDRMREERDAAQRDAERARAEAQDARADTADARADAQQARADLDRVRASLDDAQGLAEQHRADLDRARQDAAAERDAVERARIADADAPGEGARLWANRDQTDMAPLSRLVESIHALDAARSLSEVLERLTQCAALEAERVALFLVNGNRLAGWRFVGFGESLPSPSSVELAPDAAGVAGAALERGVAVSNGWDPTVEGRPAFLRDDDTRSTLALPVHVGGEVVAVLYADARDEGSAAPVARWSSALDVLTRHASRVLEAKTLQQFTGLATSDASAASAQALAQSLVEGAK